ncbi:MAG TPA: Ni/Fe-hydrogenase cytochrome b subunit [Candidatus Glassbacteria bacterium]|nr:Ni/Fe-hydrogenase cytochrome b subunit [Candidatus Glassbacteria bacterium]
MNNSNARISLSRPLVWGPPAALIMLLGLYLTFRRFYFGLGDVTALTDYQPWGLWIGFDVLCGVALAAGGFVLTGIVHLLNFERYKSVVRPTVLTAFLGYILVSVGLLYDLGKPWNIWHPLIMWNPRSVMFEVAWCVMLYSTVLAFEFSPVVLEKFRLDRVLRLVRAFTLPLVIAGILLSTLHQSSLGTIFLIVPNKLHPLWYTMLLPLHFFLSAVSVGFAMVILESFVSSRLFKRSLETHVVADLGQFMVVALMLYLIVRIQDLATKVSWAQVFAGTLESWFFLAEIACFILPLVLIFLFRNRMKKLVLVSAAGLTMLAVVLNRLNVSIIGMARSGGFSYFPSWKEIAISLFLVFMGFVVFLLATRYLPIFPAEEKAPAGATEKTA